MLLRDSSGRSVEFRLYASSGIVALRKESVDRNNPVSLFGLPG